MKVNFINSSYRRFYKKHKKEIDNAIQKCLSKGKLILQEEVSKLEKNISNYVGCKFGIGTNSGTDALFLSLKALNIDKGDEVITVANCFIAPIQAIYHTGAKPVLIDVKENGLMDETKLEKLINKNTKAIMPVHLSGRICNMNYIIKLAKKYKLSVVEDCCQSLGANKVVGDIGATSFNTPKTLGGIGDGGMAFTNNKKLAQKIHLLRNHWNIYQGSVDKNLFPQPEIMNWGFKSRLDNIQASFLNVKFKYYPEMLNRRHSIAFLYDTKLSCDFNKPEYQEGQIWQEYILKFSTEKECFEFKDFMESKGIETLTRDKIPNHKLKGLGLNCNLPITEKNAPLQLRLPIYPELTDEEVEYIIKQANNFYK
jgi:dTDP-4-amino-4,6-dideoxygalactose transaminase